MNKISFCVFSISVAILFFTNSPNPAKSFSFVTTCQPPLTTFSDGKPTFQVSFPPGGGTTCSAAVPDCPTITLPGNATVYSIKVDMVLTEPTKEIGTPYIWVPSTSAGTLYQFRTRDGSLVKIYNVTSTPSRVTVMPGGDVWTASRTGSGVTRLSPLMGSAGAGGRCRDGACQLGENLYSCSEDCAGNFCEGGANCEEYKVTGNFTASGEAKGVTFDSEGNIWVGDYESGTITKFTYSGGAVSQSAITNPEQYRYVYGMIGDPYGYVWMIAGADPKDNRRVVYLNVASNTFGIADACAIGSSNYLYGIGMDNEGNIIAANYGGGGACRIGGAGSGVNFGKVITTYNSPSGSRGVAVDGNNNVWIANSKDNNIYVFSSSGTLLRTIASGYTDIIGVAIDFDNNAWIISNGSSRVAKYGAVGGADEFNKLLEVSVAGNPYNYSDMTGFRSVPKTLSIGGSAKTPLSSTGTFNICTDGTGTCTNPTNCAFISAATNCGSGTGYCDIPLNIFSMQVGDYTLKNLEVIYGKQVPVTTGGLVPCGREWDDPATPWNDKDPCELCYILMTINRVMDFLIKLAGAVALLALIVTGFLFITSAGDQERRSSAKRAFKRVIIGFIILFLAWFLVEFLLVAWGYLDPIGGRWDFAC